LQVHILSDSGFRSAILLSALTVRELWARYDLLATRPGYRQHLVRQFLVDWLQSDAAAGLALGDPASGWRGEEPWHRAHATIVLVISPPP
ncbi:hypothetical protein K466DRAFT_667558, partial [Polyporus arcularius HHB13444]